MGQWPTSYQGHIERDFRENPIHESVHVPEFRAICQEEIERTVPPMVKQICLDTMNGILKANEYDIKNILKVSADNMQSMLVDTKTTKYVSHAVENAIKSSMQNSTINIKLQ